MPVPMAVDGSTPESLPKLSKAQIDATRTSSWYETFEDLTIPTKIVDVAELGEDKAFLEVSRGAR